MEEPDPCPWCGKPPRWYPSHRNPGLESIECANDDCSMPDDACLAGGMPYVEAEHAVDLWNRWAAKDRERLK